MATPNDDLFKASDEGGTEAYDAKHGKYNDAKIVQQALTDHGPRPADMADPFTPLRDK